MEGCNHPNYPPILPRTAMLPNALNPFPEALRADLTRRLQTGARRPVEVSRTFLALMNYNLVSHSADREIIHNELSAMNCRELRALSSACTLGIRQCGYAQPSWVSDGIAKQSILCYLGLTRGTGSCTAGSDSAADTERSPLGKTQVRYSRGQWIIPWYLTFATRGPYNVIGPYVSYPKPVTLKLHTLCHTQWARL